MSASRFPKSIAEEAERSYRVLEDFGQTSELTAELVRGAAVMKYLDEYRDSDRRL